MYFIRPIGSVLKQEIDFICFNTLPIGRIKYIDITYFYVIIYSNQDCQDQSFHLARV